jgi:glycosyltransferase involved in cell wall biosynthesis
MQAPESGQRVVFVNRYFWPDHSATSQILTELAAGVSALPLDVHVITSRQLYDDPSARLPSLDRHGRVTIHRVWTSRFGRARLKLRAIDYLCFYFSAFAKMISLCRRGDVLIAETDPPLVCVPAAAAAALKGATLVNWVQDVFPEIAGRLGLLSESGVAYRALAALRNRSLRAAGANVTLGEAMAAELIGLGIERDKIRVIPNWAVGSAAARDASADRSLRREWGLEGRFVVAYSGNLGRVHEIETFVAAAAELAADAGIVFLIIGSGAKHAALRAEVAARGLPNFIFKPYQPADRLHETLTAADAHLVSLLPELEGLVVPSKVYGILATGRPVLFVGSERGEVARLIERFGCGFRVGAGEHRALAARIRELARDPVLTKRLGRAGRAAHEQQFRFEHALALWRSTLESVGCRPAAREAGAY